MADALVRTPDGVVHYAPVLPASLRLACGLEFYDGTVVPEQPVTCAWCWQAVAAS